MIFWRGGRHTTCALWGMVLERKVRAGGARRAGRRLALALGGGVALASTAGALRAGAQEEAPAAAGVPVVGLSTDAQDYERGSAVRATISVGNPTAEPVALQYRSGQQFDLLVYRGQEGQAAGEPVWWWSADKFFTQALWERTLAPGEVLTFEVEWPQTDLGGRQVPPGEYALVGRSTSTPGGDSAPVAVRIGPETGPPREPLPEGDAAGA